MITSNIDSIRVRISRRRWWDSYQHPVMRPCGCTYRRWRNTSLSSHRNWYSWSFHSGLAAAFFTIPLSPHRIPAWSCCTSTILVGRLIIWILRHRQIVVDEQRIVGVLVPDGAAGFRGRVSGEPKTVKWPKSCCLFISSAHGIHILEDPELSISAIVHISPKSFWITRFYINYKGWLNLPLIIYINESPRWMISGIPSPSKSKVGYLNELFPSSIPHRPF